MPEVEIEEDDDYKEIHVDSVFGGLSPTVGKIILFIDKQEPKPKSRGPPGSLELEKIVKTKMAELNMSPIQFKNIAQWMASHVKQFEEKYGKIEIDKENKKPTNKRNYT